MLNVDMLGGSHARTLAVSASGRFLAVRPLAVTIIRTATITTTSMIEPTG